MIKEADLKLKYVGGASFVKHKPKFSKDSQFIIVASTKSLFGYITKTGKRFIEYKGLKEDIVGFDLYVKDGVEYLIACTVDGNVAIWRVANGLKLIQASVSQKNVRIFKVFEYVSNVYKIFIAWQDENSLNLGMISNFQKFKVQQLKKYISNYRKNCKFDIGYSQDCQFLALLMGKKMLITRLDESSQIVKIRMGRKFTCIECHPTKEAILTGDSSGRVVLWHNIFAKYTQAVYHWHTLPVNTVCFSNSGTTFYSGGNECVLVRWIEENANQKKFLPRLPRYIEQLSIAPENLYLAVATNDNAIHIIDMQFHVISIIQELVLGDNFSAGLQVDPRTKTLVLNGGVGHVQFYAPHNMELLYNLDVVGMNRITDERDTIMVNTDVKAIALSKNGLWIATVEERDEDFSECRLKFFNYDVTEQTFKLNTNVEYAHESNIVDLKFQPSNKKDSLRLVTIAEDGFFKVWQLIDATTVYTKGFTWRCASSGYYRDLNPTSLAFSHDGSLLAVSFDNILTTWLPDTMKQKCTLVHPRYQEKIKSLAFGTNTQCYLIVVASQRRLCVWNLLTLSMIWTVPLKVSRLIADSLTTHMGAITEDNKLFIFEPLSETPIYIHKDLVPSDNSLIAATFVPNASMTGDPKKWYNKTQLYIIDSNKELYCLESYDASDDAFEPMSYMLNETQSMFSLMTPAHKTSAQSAQKPIVHNFTQKPACRKMDDLLDAPIYSMVPPRMVAHAIISSMIYENQQKKSSDSSESENSGSNPAAVEIIDLTDVDQLNDDLAAISLQEVTWTSVYADG